MRVRLAACAALLLILGACTAGGTASPRPATALPGTASPVAASQAVASREPAATPAASIATTGTSWGVILDQAPSAFPRYPGAADANGATTDPVSQSVSTSASVATVSGWYATALSPIGYKQTSISNPAEDGSVVAEFDGGSLGSGCRAQITYKPMGSLTLIFVLVAAGCPAS